MVESAHPAYRTREHRLYELIRRQREWNATDLQLATAIDAFIEDEIRAREAAQPRVFGGFSYDDG